MTDGERHATRRDIAGPLRVPGVDPVGIRVRDPRSLGGAIDHECEHRGRIRWDLPVGWRQSHPKPTGAELGGRAFAGRTVMASYHDPARYAEGDLA